MFVMKQRRLALDDGLGLATVPSSAIPMGRRRKLDARDAIIRAAGIVLVTPDGLALFLRRSSIGDHKGQWCWPGGKIEGAEEPLEIALRETHEETGFEPESEPEEIDARESDEGVDFTTFRVEVDAPFIPTLDGEHNGWAWAPLSDPPSSFRL